MSRLLPILGGPTGGYLTLPQYGGRLEGAADHSLWPVAAPRVRRGRPRHEPAAELLRRLAAQPRATAEAAAEEAAVEAAARQVQELAAQARALARQARALAQAARARAQPGC